MRQMMLGVMLAMALAPQAFAQAPAEEGDPVKGREIARMWCANCHVVEDNPARGADTAATFATIAGRAGVTADGLRAFLSAQHSTASQGRMPNLSLSRNDVDNVVAYLLSLRGR
jgi:mono/diheme cytochrome c family protein